MSLPRWSARRSRSRRCGARIGCFMSNSMSRAWRRRSSPRAPRAATSPRSCASAAPANSPVLIEGESGTGKELIARMLHHWSSRAQGPFVKLSFKLLAPIESSLAMSDSAHGRRQESRAMLSEYVERATGGTLFLDEISEATRGVSIRTAAAYRRRRASRNYGAAHGRVATCGSEDRGLDQSALTHEVAGGRIRPDLYFALNVIAIQVAPLRERSEDILPLARHFLALHAAETGRSLVLTPDAEKALLAYSWPGNVRELENVIERAVVMSSSERISADALMLRTENAAIADSPRHHARRILCRRRSRPRLVSRGRGGRLQNSLRRRGSRRNRNDCAQRKRSRERQFRWRARCRNSSIARPRFESGRRSIPRRAIAMPPPTALGIDRTTLYRLMRRLGL